MRIIDLFTKEHRIYFDLRALRRSYCCKCGNKLKRKYKKIGSQKTHKYIKLVYNVNYVCLKLVYYCPVCNYYINYKNQKKVMSSQKEQKKYILDNSKRIIRMFKYEEKYGYLFEQDQK